MKIGIFPFLPPVIAIGWDLYNIQTLIDVQTEILPQNWTMQ